MVNFRKKVLALALALMVLLAGLFSVFRGKTTVSADGYVYPPYQGGVPEKVVYITDRATNDFSGMIEDCIEELGWVYPMSDWFEVPTETIYVTAESFILKCYAKGEFDCIKNSAVILDFHSISLNEFYPVYVGSANGITLTTQVLDCLLNIVQWWKANGCRVMFINSTEETLILQDDRDFFEDLDIHINTDLLTLFSDTIVSIIEEEGKIGFVHDCAILLNTLDSDHVYENAFIQFLIHSLRHSRGNVDRINEYVNSNPVYTHSVDYDVENSSDEDMLKYLNIQILTYDEYDDENDYLKLIELSATHKLIAVGFSWEEIGLTTWANCLKGHTDNLGGGFPVYCYSHGGFSATEREAFNELPQHFLCSGPDNYLGIYLPGILIYFLIGDPLGPYNNWDGGCDVTHKAITFSSDGWLNNYCRIHDPDNLAGRLSDEVFYENNP